MFIFNYVLVGVYMCNLTGLLQRTEGYRISSICRSDEDCSWIENAICDTNNNQCVCPPARPVRVNANTCIKGSKLGEKCEMSDSCRYFDKHSSCNTVRGCVCDFGYRRIQKRFRAFEEGKCVKKEDAASYFTQQSYFSDFSDDDDNDDDHSGADGDSSEEDDDDKRRASDITTPIIVGLVLGSLIVCGWSFAICRLYLKRSEKKRLRKRRKRIRHGSTSGHRHSRSRSRTPAANPASPATLNHTQYTLLGFPIDLPPQIDESWPVNTPSPPPRHASLPCPPMSHSIPSLGTISPSPPPVISPEEEPLPAYNLPSRREGESEPPPSYEEAMKNEEKPTTRPSSPEMPPLSSN